jgi:hypothetical protein
MRRPIVRMPAPDPTPLTSNGAPPSSNGDDELPTVPHSFPPLSGSSEEGADEALPENESAWGEVWRRRWLVAGAAALAFLSALALGRLSVPKRSTLPPSTVSGASLPSDTAPPSEAERGKIPPPNEARGPSPDAVGVQEGPDSVPRAPTPVATSEALEIPAMEVPPSKGASSGKTQTRRAAPQSGSTPRKRFMPGAI